MGHSGKQLALPHTGKSRQKHLPSKLSHRSMRSSHGAQLQSSAGLPQAEGGDVDGTLL